MGPTAFGPAAFGPTAFGPAAFGPTAFGPTAFGPTAFGPAAFGPAAFGPAAFGPTAFGPTAPAPRHMQIRHHRPAPPAGRRPVLSRTDRSTGRRAAALLALVAGLLVVAGCDSVERLDPERPRAEMATVTSVGFEVPDILRGTIAQDTIISGYQPVPVHGYGLVVGLDGTGSTLLPPDLREHMLRDMRRRGVGSPQAGMGGLDPGAMLDDAGTAVVIVEGLVPPGAIGRRDRAGGAAPGTRFDVRVFADPRTGATSIEGGRLYTMELRPVRPGAVFPPAGSAQAAALARARGPIVVNPFAQRDGMGLDDVDRTTGLIMNGGEVIEDIPMKLRLLTPSHARAGLIQAAVNTRFPREPGQPDDTARGESDESVRITVPPSYGDRPEEFISLLKHTSVRQVRPEAVAARVRRIVENDPEVAGLAAWRWEALGPRALPMIRELYDHPAETPRMASLRAGSRLGDPLVIPDLLEMTRSDEPTTRMQAARLLEPLEGDARIDARLAELLDDADLDVRLVAYESLNARDAMAVERFTVGGRFRLDLVESRYPLVYVAQTGTPRVVLFDADLEIKRPMLAEAFGGRMIMKASPLADQIEIYYRPAAGGPAITTEVSSDLASFILFLARVPDDEDPETAGLALSYADTLSVLYVLKQKDALDADFKAEQDRVRAAILRQREAAPERESRPLFEVPDAAERAPEIDDVLREEAPGTLPPAERGDSDGPRAVPRMQTPPPAERPLGIEPPSLDGPPAIPPGSPSGG